MLNVGLEQQQQIRGGDGTLLWSGGQVAGVDYHIKNTDTVAMAIGEGVRWDATNGILPRQETTAAGGTPSTDLPMSRALAGIRIASATDLLFCGVAVEPIPVNGTGLVYGVGSLVTVITTVTALALGTTVGGSANAGQAAVNTTATQILGTVFKINTSAATGTGSTGFAGILVNPR